MSRTVGKLRARGRVLMTLCGVVLGVCGTAGVARAQTNEAPVCSDGRELTDPFDGPYWNGWGNGPDQRRLQTGGMARLMPGEVPGLRLKWAFGLPGVSRAFGQPTVASGRVFFGTETGTVYSLDADTGCLYWSFQADGPVRTAMSVGAAGDDWAVYFGDQTGVAYALDATSGEELWRREIDDHPGAVITGAPVFAQGRLYVPASSAEEALAVAAAYPCCTFRGSVSALDASTGELIWKSHTIPEEPAPVRLNAVGTQMFGPSGAAVWSSPTVDLEAGRVYVMTGDSYSDPPAPTSDAFVAFDIETGDLVWSSQMTEGDAFNVACGLPGDLSANCPEAQGPDFDFGSSAVLIELEDGGRALIAGQKSGLVHAVDPDREGALLWQTRIGAGSALGGIQWGIATDGERVYAAVSDIGWAAPAEGASGGQPSIAGLPMMLDPNAGGGLFALDSASGDIVWEAPHPGCDDVPDCSPAQSAAVTVIPGIVFSGGLDGHLRGYSTENGRVVWDVDTKREYTTLNGVEAKGGSLDGPGPVVVDGVLYVNSGYLFLGQTPGNVLLAFSTEAP